MFYYFEICFHADILLEKLNENINIIVVNENGTWIIYSSNIIRER